MSTAGRAVIEFVESLEGEGPSGSHEHQREILQAILDGLPGFALAFYEASLISIYPGGWDLATPPNVSRSEANAVVIDRTIYTPEKVLVSPGYFTAEDYASRVRAIRRFGAETIVKHQDRDEFLAAMTRFAIALRQTETV